LAIAALRRLLVDPRLLDRMELRTLLPQLRKAFDRGDAPVPDGPDGRYARADLFLVDQHGARAALRESAAEHRAVQSELVAQDVEQRRIGRRFDDVTLTVDRDRLRHGSLLVLGYYEFS